MEQSVTIDNQFVLIQPEVLQVGPDLSHQQLSDSIKLIGDKVIPSLK